jgi:hypothetical protein
MKIPLVDRRNYYRGLLILARKDQRIDEREREWMMRQGEILDFDRRFCQAAIDELFDNKHILYEPIRFSTKEVAEHFLLDAAILALIDGKLHPKELSWLKQLRMQTTSLPTDSSVQNRRASLKKRGSTREEAQSTGAIASLMHHGHGGKKDEADMDAERFFRAIDRAILEHHSQPSGLPLILAALPEHHHLFHRVSHNPFLIAEGLTINPDALPIDRLRERVWQVIEPQYQAQLSALADEFAVAKSNGLGSDDLSQVAQAAAAGRVATLLIESDRQIAGRLDGSMGRIEVANLNHPQVDDLLDDLGELVGKMGGRVLVIPAERRRRDWLPLTVIELITITIGEPFRYNKSSKVKRGSG